MAEYLTPWLLWFIGGIALAIFEVVVPGFILIFFGMGCWVVAGLLLMFDLSVTQQAWIFLGSSVLSLLIMRRYVMNIFGGDQHKEDHLLDLPQGTGKVVEAIGEHSPGRVAWRGSFWPAQAEEAIAEGTPVSINGYVAGSRSVLWVKSLD
ncbi:MAG: NfeD family protein [Desulfuromonas sp.]|nr:NfeD family protein [Desulfuromonas sp.]